MSRTVLTAGLIGAIALIDWRVELNVAFGFLYLFPINLAGSVLAHWQVMLVAVPCTSLANLFDPLPFVAGADEPHAKQRARIGRPQREEHRGDGVDELGGRFNQGHRQRTRDAVRRPPP